MKNLCLIFLMILMCSSIVLTSNRIRIETTATASGDTGKFYIVMENDLIINGFQFTLQYEPEYITPIRINPKNNAGSLTGSSASLFGDNRITFLVYDHGFNFVAIDSSVIFEVEFIAKDTISQATRTGLIFTDAILVDPDNNTLLFEFIDAEITLDPFVYVEDITTLLPTKFELYQNYPNPANPTTIIKFEIPKQSRVKLTVYDILGSEIITLVNEELQAGWYERSFNLINYASGVYIYRLQAGYPLSGSGQSFVQTKKMILLK